MNHSEIIALVNQFEKNFPVDQWTIHGIHVWPLIRIQLYFEITNHRERPGINERRSRWRLEQLSKHIVDGLRFVSAYCFDFSKNARIPSSVSAVFLSDGQSYASIMGRYYEKFCGPMIQILESKGFPCLLLNPLNNYHIPRYGRSRFIQPRLDWIKLTVFLFPNRYSNLKHNLPGFETFLERLRLLLPFVEMDVRVLQRQTAIIDRFARFFEQILREGKALIGFGVSYGGYEGFAFNLACRRLGIASVDIQHGFEGELHPAYGRWSKIPKNGYELLPTIFWCWDEPSRRAIDEWAMPFKDYHRAVVGGNLFMEIWRSGRAEYAIYYQKQISERINELGKRRNVLATLQPLFAGPEFMALLSALAEKTSTSTNWWIRVHPVMMHQKAAIVKRFKDYRNVDVGQATDIPLFALLPNMDVHVTHSSAAVLDAEAFGVGSVVTSRYGLELIPDQVASGIVQFAETLEDIISAIDRQAIKKREANQIRSASSDLLERGCELLMETVSSAKQQLP